MKHAGYSALQEIDQLLAALRALGVLKERSLGVFYHQSQAFLHFHEDPAGLFADLKEGAKFARYGLKTGADQEGFLERVNASLAQRTKRSPRTP